MNKAVPEICFGNGTALSYPLPYAKARNSALLNSEYKGRFLQSSVPLWHRDSLVLSIALCQSLEFSLTEFQDRKPFFPKALFRFGPVEPGFIQFPVPKPVKTGFYKALCCFGTGTALSYPLPYAKAWKGRFPQSSVSLWHRYSLVLSNSLCQSLEFSLTEFQDRKPFSPKLCSALATVQPCLIHCLMPKPVKAGFYKALCRFGTGTAVGLFFFKPKPLAKARYIKPG